MGENPTESVVDSRARSHDHENLFIPGAPSMVTGGCTNGTLTFCALGLMSADEIGRAYPTREGSAAA
jgi:quinoprotein glucose dehydrogenase